jgi:hypothetical protein
MQLVNLFSDSFKSLAEYIFDFFTKTLPSIVEKIRVATSGFNKLGELWAGFKDTIGL